MKKTIFTKFAWVLAFYAFIFTSVLYVACTKDIIATKEENLASSQHETMAMLSSNKAPNPFSVVNIQQALADLGRTDPLESDRIYHYYSFNPSNITGDMLAIIEADENHHILNFPFADGDVYKDAFMSSFDPNNMAYTSGNLYIVFKTGGTLDNLFQNNSQLGATKLDELYLPKEEDEDLQVKAMANAQNVTVEAFRISWPCLFKRPHGRVTYLDSEINANRGVPNMQVWALAFGIPVTTQTDANGNYQIPWLFSVGTVMGTHAKNTHVNVKPFDVTGNFLDVLIQLTGNFILGSLYIEGTASACQMKNDINITFNQNNQRRYWAQLLDIVRLHHTFAAQDGINSAPSRLVWYAAWDNHRGDAFSASMLSHISLNGSVLRDNILSLVFNTNLANNAPNFLNLLTGLLPSITTDESPASMNNEHYSERLAQSAFHELAHASLFTQVGQIYWTEVISNIVIASAFSSCSGYGCGNEPFAGNASVNEAWAEYLGKDYHRRMHPNGQADIGSETWTSYPVALETDLTFVNLWIPTGMFFDLTDGFSSSEPTNNIQGFSNSQMFNTFSPNIHSLCDYKNRFIQLNPNIATAQFNGVFAQNGSPNCN